MRIIMALPLGWPPKLGRTWLLSAMGSLLDRLGVDNTPWCLDAEGPRLSGAGSFRCHVWRGVKLPALTAVLAPTTVSLTGCDLHMFTSPLVGGCGVTRTCWYSDPTSTRAPGRGPALSLALPLGRLPLAGDRGLAVCPGVGDLRLVGPEVAALGLGLERHYWTVSSPPKHPSQSLVFMGSLPPTRPFGPGVNSAGSKKALRPGRPALPGISPALGPRSQARMEPRFSVSIS